MKIQTIKTAFLDQYGFKYVHKTQTKIYKNKQVAIETIGGENNPIYKRVTDGKTTKEFDMGLFSKWIERKQS